MTSIAEMRDMGKKETGEVVNEVDEVINEAKKKGNRRAKRRRRRSARQNRRATRRPMQRGTYRYDIFTFYRSSADK
jgi:hypothetical protein